MSDVKAWMAEIQVMDLTKMLREWLDYEGPELGCSYTVVDTCLGTDLEQASERVADFIEAYCKTVQELAERMGPGEKFVPEGPFFSFPFTAVDGSSVNLEVVMLENAPSPENLLTFKLLIVMQDESKSLPLPKH